MFYWPGPVVQSKTITGTKQHKRGTVEANIVKANIPVQNGIVHLIDRPLVIMANTLYEHLCVERTVQVSSELSRHWNIGIQNFNLFLAAEVSRILQIFETISSIV